MHQETHWTRRLPRRTGRRRLLSAAALAGAGLAGATLLACSGGTKDDEQPASAAGQAASQGTSEPPRTGGTLNAYLPTNYPLDPQKVSALAQQVPGGAMSRLFRYQTGPSPDVILDHLIENDLAVSVESPDAITWTVKLRPDARFHNIAPVNGRAVEAEDVKATFVRALDPATASPNRGALGMIDPGQIQMPDKATVVFKLGYPYAPFRQTLTSATYSWILPREAQTGGYDPAKQVIGSGPFILENVTPDVANTYKRNPAWFEQGRPYLDGLRVAIIPDTAQQLAQFTGGNLDELEIRNPFDVQTVKQTNPKAGVVRVANGNPNPLYFQLGDPTSAFQDIRVRRAFSMAIDRDALGKVVYDGQTLRTVFLPAYLGKWSLPVDKLDPSIGQYYKHNPSEAKKLLEAAGVANIQIRFANPFASLGNQDTAKSVETINNMFNAAGIKSSIVPLDYNKDFVGGGKGIRQGYFDKDMVVYGAASVYSEADEFLFSYFHSKSLSNGEHLNDAALDAMIEKQRTILDDEARLKAVHEIQTYLAEKLYAPSSVGGYRWYFAQQRVQNYNYTDSLGKVTETYAKLWLRG